MIEIMYKELNGQSFKKQPYYMIVNYYLNYSKTII